MEKSVVLFTAPWCQPCQALKKRIEGLSGKIQHAKLKIIDIAQDADAARQYGVKSVPTILHEGVRYNAQISDDVLTKILS